MQVYHQTSPEIAKLILASAFRPGTRGWCGGAIYFAVTPGQTYEKAIGTDSHMGAIIEATVDVGRVLNMLPECDQNMTAAILASEGYDSISFNPGDGDEVVLYDSSRVLSMRLLK